MAFIKKHFVWLLLGLILVGEGALTFMLVGRHKAAEQKFEELSSDQNRHRSLLKYTDIKDAEAALKKNREYLDDQLKYCVLFFWNRDRAIEAMFDAKELEPYNLHAWDKAPPNLDSFKDKYQIAYNRAADAVSKLAEEKLKIDRGGLGFASTTAFTQPHVMIGDIFGAQKEFWIRKALVDVALKAEISELDPIQVNRRPGLVRGRRRSGPSEEDKKAVLQKAIEVDIVVRCPYPKLGAFIAELYRSPLSFRVKQLDEIIRGQSKTSGGGGRRVRGFRRPTLRGGRTAEAMMEGDGAEMPAPRPAPRPDPEEMMAPPPTRGGLPPGMAVPTEPTDESAPPEEAVVEAHILCEVNDFTFGITKARFANGLGSKDKVRAWLQSKLSSRRSAKSLYAPLWEASLKALDGAEVKEEGESVEIVFRPEDQFSPEQTYPMSFGDERTGTADYELRMVTYNPVESDEGIVPATTNMR